MGITGLIPFLEKVSSKTNIKDMKGYTVAIDTYCWLHKGAFGCADKLSRGEETDVYVNYCLKYINLLLSHNIKPILVFDGRHLPAKALTEMRRRESRQQSKKRAAELFRLGRTEEARSHMKRCVDITHEMALKLIQQCRARNVDCIVAPYEADAQLAYLNKLNIAQYVITEDSDLVLFGCKKIIFKLDLMGNCLLVDASNLHLAMGCHPEKFTFDKFRNMCILSGCDYLDSLPGIGLAKACKFILKTEETDMTKALKKIPQYLNMKNLTVTDDYIEAFLMAEATFKHMFVYDPFERAMVRLNELPYDTDEYERLCSNAGKILQNEIAFELALGNLNPFTLNKLDNWSPDQLLLYDNIKTNSWQQTTRTKHKSIWKSSFVAHVPKEKQTFNAISFQKIKYKSIEYNSVPEESSLSNFETESSIVSMYCAPDEQPASKRICLEKNTSESTDTSENNNESDDTKSHNPFAKHAVEAFSPSRTSHLNTSLLKTLSPTKKSNNYTDCKLAKLSKFKRTIVSDEKKEIKSRFFFSNTRLLERSSEIHSEKIDENKNYELEKEVAQIECQSDEMTLKNIAFYSPRKKMCVVENSDVTTSVKNNEDEEHDICDKSDSEPTTSQKENDNTSLFEDLNSNKFQEDIIVISDTDQRTIKLNQSKINSRHVISKRKTKVISKKNSDAQTRLSMFGFQKRPSI